MGKKLITYMAKKAEEKEILIDSLLNNIKYICESGRKSKLLIDNNLAESMERIFTKEKDNTKFVFPIINVEKYRIKYDLIKKFVELLMYLFNFEDKKRNILYTIKIDLIKDNKIIILIKELKELFKKVDIEEKTEKEFNILNGIYKSNLKALKNLDKKRIVDLMDQIILNIGYSANNSLQIKFCSFCIIRNVFLKEVEKKGFTFEEVQFDVENQICRNLITDLFNNKFNPNLNIIISYIVLNFNLLKTIIKEYNLINIEKAAENSINKIKKLYPPSYIITAEKINLTFIEEYQKLSSKERNIQKQINMDNSNEKKRGENKFDNNNKIKEDSDSIKDIISEKTKENKLDSSKNNNTSEVSKNIINVIKDDNCGKENEISAEKSDDRDYSEKQVNITGAVNKSENLNDDLKRVNLDYINEINKILKNIKMDSKSYSDLKDIFDKLLNKVDKVDKLEEEVKHLNIEVQKLNNQNEEIKNILGKIQCRTQSKIFLKRMNYYLEKEDIDLINDYKVKMVDKIYEKINAIIVKRLDEKFKDKKDNEKFLLIKILLKKVCDSLDEGNINAHSLTLDIYQKEIDNYKKQKNISTISCPHIFCFLLGIGFKNDIDASYSFLDEFFDMNLDLKLWKEPDFIRKYLSK